MASGPTIGVALPSYNAEKWIVQTLESILGQTSPPNEVVVVDDGSTDDTVRVVRSFGDRIRIVEQENRGPAAAYNRAVRETSGEYVAITGSDDLWEPRKLEWQRETLTRHPEVDIAVGHMHTFGESDHPWIRPSGRGVLDPAPLQRELFGHNVLGAPTAVIRKRLHDELGGFREDLPFEDYDFWLRALRAGATFFYDDRLQVRYRRHGANYSSDQLRMLEGTCRVRVAHASEIDDLRTVRSVLSRDLKELGWYRLKAGHRRAARAAYAASLRYRLDPKVAGWLVALVHPRLTAAALRVKAALHR
jgi:glycosyltransferase involved in cell wall biosynthesis